MSGFIKNFQEIPVTVVPVLDTAIYASGDVLFVPTLVTVQAQVGLGNNKRLRVRIRDITVLDSDNEQATFDLVFLTATVASFGALNAACGLSDADMVAQVRRLVTVSGYTVMGAASNCIAQPGFDPFTIQCPAGATGFYIAGIARGGNTYTAASDLKLIFGLEILNDVHA